MSGGAEPVGARPGTGSAPRLCDAALAGLDPARIAVPAYDRRALPFSVLHLGPGAFHRAHQADYFDRLNALEPSWGIAAVALRSRAVPDALQFQDGLYTLVTLDRRVSYRVIGALRTILHGHDPLALRLFLAPSLRLVTLTVTEKGYCLDAAGALDWGHPDIAHDLAAGGQGPSSAIGWLVAGLALRRDAGLGALTVLSCDNLPSNGRTLRAAVLAFSAARDPALAAWIESEVRFPSSMVDSITPASDEALRERVAREAGVSDAWPIQREAFTSWVIEELDDPRAPRLDRVGALFTSDVAGHEQAKLRMLNGAHSALAYLGLALGHETVAEAVADPRLSAYARLLMAQEIAPSLSPPAGLDLEAYREALLQRFANPAIRHLLAQIAWDGSQKLPIRLAPTVRDNLASGRPIGRLVMGLAAWCRFIVRAARAEREIVDPMAARLAALGRAATDDACADAPLFLSLHTVFGAELAASPVFEAAMKEAYVRVIEMERMRREAA